MEIRNPLGSLAYSHYNTPRTLKGAYEWVNENGCISHETLEIVPEREILKIASAAPAAFSVPIKGVSVARC